MSSFLWAISHSLYALSSTKCKIHEKNMSWGLTCTIQSVYTVTMKQLQAYIARHYNGSETQFAAHVGVTVSCVGHWLAGRRVPSRKHVLRIHRLTGISLTVLLRGDA